MTRSLTSDDDGVGMGDDAASRPNGKVAGKSVRRSAPGIGSRRKSYEAEPSGAAMMLVKEEEEEKGERTGQLQDLYSVFWSTVYFVVIVNGCCYCYL